MLKIKSYSSRGELSTHWELSTKIFRGQYLEIVHQKWKLSTKNGQFPVKTEKIRRLRRQNAH